MVVRFAAALMLAWSCVAAGASGWSRPEESAVREEDLLFNDPFSGGFGTRAVHFSGRLDDGTLYHFSVFRWHYGLLGGWGLSVVVSLLDGTVYAREEKIPDRAIRIAADRFDLIFGEGRIWGEDGRYRVRLSLPDFSCDLTVTNLLPLWQPGDGFVLGASAAQAFMRYGVHSPWALTEGWMAVDGRLLSGKGQGFGDRSRAVFPLAQINPGLLAFDGFSDPRVPEEERWFLRVLSYRTHKAFGARQIAVVILARGGRSLMTVSDLQLSELDVRPDADGIPRPLGFQVLSSDSGGCQLAGEFVCQQASHTSDVFRKLPAALRGFASTLFRRPIVMRDRGTFRGTVRLPDGSLHPLELYGQSEYALVQ
jgi:hypothetical protein